jgi:cyclopropane fatty-acyl-phospholipid synthase-like methyltransferase
MLISATEHYDKLIDMDNDPFFDPDNLKKYMDNWDGEEFFKELNLNIEQNVLEIGIGTGRIAMKTAGKCKRLTGIDLSFKTCQRAIKNLSNFNNVNIVNGDFISATFHEKFDVIYSTLTFMHIENKPEAFSKVYDILSKKGRFILSVTKNMNKYIDMGNYKVEIFPSDKSQTEKMLNGKGFIIERIIEKEMSYIFTCKK